MTVEELDTRIQLARQAKRARITAPPTRRDMNTKDRYVLTCLDFDRLYNEDGLGTISTHEIGRQNRARLLEGCRQLMAAGELVSERSLARVTGMSKFTVGQTRKLLVQSGQWPCEVHGRVG